MRDILITLLVFGSLPYILMRPYVGVLVWSWLGYMNPHRLTYGFAYNFPFSSLVAMFTLAALVFSREPKRIPLSAVTILWLLFVGWMTLTTQFAMIYDDAVIELKRTLKIQLIVLITLMVIYNRERLNLLIWVIVFSIGFYGIKGGIFSILTGGNFIVWGPEDSFIKGNNELALALIMIIPFMRYLQLTVENAWIKRGLWAAFGLSLISIVVSYSRGAFLGMGIMIAFMILKTRHRALFIILSIIAVIGVAMFVPDKYWDRMGTIQNYEEDASAMGRINAWEFAYNIAKLNPITGGGFNVFDRDLFKLHAPNPDDHHDAHSIYFEVLGEHGFIGLFIFLSMWATAFFTASRVIRRCKEHESLHWARDLAAMCQVSMIGYGAGGAFLGLAYYDLPYHIIAIVIITNMLVEKEIEPVKQNPWANNPFAAPKGNSPETGPTEHPAAAAKQKPRYLPKGFVSPYERK